MSDELSPLPLPDPTLRFRLHSLLGVTAVVAVLAALAGPYYRGQSADAQAQLLSYWSLLGVFTAVGLWNRWRTMWRVPPVAGAMRFLVWSSSKQRRRAWSIIRSGLLLVGWVGFIALSSDQIVQRAGRLTSTRSMWFPFFQGVAHGMMTGGALVVFVRTPTYLCENGVAFGRALAPWHYIRHAEWLEKRPDVMKFRRLDGDIFVAVERRARESVEAFVRKKTSLVEAPRDGNEKPPVCAGG